MAKKQFRTYSCGICRGTGKIKCDICNGTKVKPRSDNLFQSCKKCSSTGEIKCPKCNGTGRTCIKENAIKHNAI